MTARARVLEAYGSRCAWCQTTTGPFEIDHIHGEGNTHRKTLRKSIEYWLVDEYNTTGIWPRAVQLLCQQCHNRKSGRISPMPARKGADQHNVTLPESVGARLAILASDPLYGSKSRVVEAALRLLVEGDANHGFVDSVQQQLSAFQATVVEHLDTVQQQMRLVLAKMHELDVRIGRMEETAQRRYEETKSAHDRLVRRLPEPGAKPGLLSKFLG
jgi:hypothetical protein